MDDKQSPPEGPGSPVDASIANFLQEKLRSFKEKNPRFSLRSFAEKAGIAPGAFAELLHGKRPLSDFYAEKISVGLNLSAAEKSLIFSFVTTRSRRMSRQKILNEHEIQMMASWVPYAVLNLMKTNGFKSEPEWVAKRLGLSVVEIQNWFELLSRLGLIVIKRGKWLRAFESLNTSQEIPSTALVQAHKQDLLKAIQVLEQTPPSARSFTSTTMPISVEKLDKAKKLIAKFHRQICSLLECGDKEEVYNLNVQLFPVTVLNHSEQKDRT